MASCMLSIVAQSQLQQSWRSGSRSSSSSTRCQWLADRNVVRFATNKQKLGPSAGPSFVMRDDARAMRDCQCTTLLCEAALCRCRSCVMQPSAPPLVRSRTLHVLQKRAPPSHILPFDALYCSLQPDDELCVCARSLEYNCLDEQVKQALRTAWRGASHLKL